MTFTFLYEKVHFFSVQMSTQFYTKYSNIMKVIDLVTTLKGILRHKILVYVITILNPLRSRYMYPIILTVFNVLFMLKTLCCLIIIMLYYKYAVFIVYFALLKLCHIVAYVLIVFRL